MSTSWLTPCVDLQHAQTTATLACVHIGHGTRIAQAPSPLHPGGQDPAQREAAEKGDLNRTTRGDRRFLAEPEQAEREEKEKEREASAEDKVCGSRSLKSSVDLPLRKFEQDMRPYAPPSPRPGMTSSDSRKPLTRSGARTTTTLSHTPPNRPPSHRDARARAELVEYRAAALERDATIRAMQQWVDEWEAATTGTSDDPTQNRSREDEH